MGCLVGVQALGWVRCESLNMGLVSAERYENVDADGMFARLIPRSGDPWLARHPLLLDCWMDDCTLPKPGTCLRWPGRPPHLLPLAPGVPCHDSHL